MAMQAQETFVADLADGTSVRVVKGEVLPDAHELVKRDQAGTAQLFKRLNMGEEEPQAPAHAEQKPTTPKATTQKAPAADQKRSSSTAKKA